MNLSVAEEILPHVETQLIASLVLYCSLTQACVRYLSYGNRIKFSILHPHGNS